MIRARITSVTITCVITSLTTFYILAAWGGYTSSNVLHAMGYWPVGVLEALRALLLTALLFLGPLFESLVVESGWRDWTTLAPVREVLDEMTAWRNIVAVSPHSPPLPPFSQRKESPLQQKNSKLTDARGL